jgi:hypothetical protein
VRIQLLAARCVSGLYVAEHIINHLWKSTQGCGTSLLDIDSR